MLFFLGLILIIIYWQKVRLHFKYLELFENFNEKGSKGIEKDAWLTLVAFLPVFLNHKDDKNSGEDVKKIISKIMLLLKLTILIILIMTLIKLFF